MSQLPVDRRETWITGIGLVSSLGDGLEANWDALRCGRINVDLGKYAPWIVHPLVPLDLDSQIPKKSDQRQMEAWQRIGTYAAGLALDSVGIKDDKEILARTDMIVAAGGGERDLDVNSAVLTARADGRSGALNERLMNDLRPTLFLAQLSNLLAGNISIVHGVSGSSRTFMGEEAAGVDAVRVAWAKIASGQSEIALVGAAHNGERKEMLMLYECGGFNLKKEFASVWSRNGGGFALGSGGVFLVLEFETACGAPRRQTVCAAGQRRLRSFLSICPGRGRERSGESLGLPGGRRECNRDLHGSDGRCRCHRGRSSLPVGTPRCPRPRDRHLLRTSQRSAIPVGIGPRFVEPIPR